MGNHNAGKDARPGQSTEGLQVLRVQVWTQVDKTMVAASGLYITDGSNANQALGSLQVRYPVLELPAVGQVMYALGDELRRNWAVFGKAQ